MKVLLNYIKPLKNKLSLSIFFVFTSCLLVAQTQIGGDIEGTVGKDQLGNSVAISNNGNRVIVGAIAFDFDSLKTGYARVYDYDGTNWVQVGSDIEGEADQDRFGISASIAANGSRVAVGANLNSASGPAAGHTRIYDFDGSDWVQVGNDIDAENAYDHSGHSIDLSADGSKIAIGALFNADAGSQAGQVRVFEFNGTDWVQMGNDVDGSDNRLFGQTVSISADGTRFVGGANESVRIYEWDGTDWTQLGTDIKDSTPYISGSFVTAISDDGTRVVVSFENGGYATGEARVYEYDGTDWSQLGTTILGNGTANSFGFSASISGNGNRIVVGDPVIYMPGLAQVYDFDGTDWVKIGDDIVGEMADDEFGWSVMLTPDGSNVIIGAPKNGENSSESGQARIYELPPVLLTSVEETVVQSIEAQITPNPSNGQFTFRFENTALQPVSLTVFNNEGKMVLKEQLEAVNQQSEHHITLSTSGVYFLQIGIGSRLITEKLIVR